MYVQTSPGKQSSATGQKLNDLMNCHCSSDSDKVLLVQRFLMFWGRMKEGDSIVAALS